MNAAAVLALLGEMYAQIAELKAENARLRDALAAKDGE